MARISINISSSSIDSMEKNKGNVLTVLTPRSTETLRSPENSDLIKQRKKKFTGGNASKRHRDRVNIEFTNLAKLLPFSQSVVAKLDKSSILRLAVSYIRAKSFFKDVKYRFDEESKELKGADVLGDQIQEGTGVVSHIFSQALDGFLLVLTEDMKVLFVSESVRDYLGYCQAGIIHESFLQFVNPADENLVRNSMRYKTEELERHGNTEIFDAILHKQTVRDTDGRERTNIAAPRKFVCRMKCAFSCSSRFYTAYRTFEFSGHLRRSAIQEGREQKTVNTLVVFGTPLVANGSSAALDVVHDISSSSQNTLNDEMVIYEKSGGFRIEPTLRPHIAPIPVKNHEGIIGRQRHSLPQSKTSQPPSLIPADVYDRHNYMIAGNIQNYQNRTTNGYVTSGSSDSRYSDHSDDSKCSPVASPNLSWKVNRTASPHYGDKQRRFDYISFKSRSNKEIRNPDDMELERHRGNILLKRDTDLLRKSHSPQSYMFYSHSEKDKRDVYVGAEMLMNLRHISPNAQQIHNRKRHIENDYLDYPVKRSKSASPGKINNFNISHLLGFDDSRRLEKIEASPDISYTDQYVEVCEIDDEPTARKKGMHNIIHAMSQNLDAAFRRTMADKD